ncbi:MAG: prepilin-type N-terminal cleavage/methylation domain-containing protein [Candidatus Wallbacteria bacterium]|nr:prepilin-type N-terminal cleavage/methylation domain-containing protein [Candidatus Wallbacteria bacterium]
MPDRLNRGFSLLEWSVVTFIIAILLAVLIPSVTKSMERARLVRARDDIDRISGIIRNYQSRFGRWPTRIDDLPPGMMDSSGKRDPWGNPYTIWNFRIGCQENREHGKTVNLAYSSQFRFSQLYAFGANSTGQSGIWLSANGGETFALLHDTTPLTPTTSYFSLVEQPILSAGRILLFDRPAGKYFVFDPSRNILKTFDGIFDSCIVSSGMAWVMDPAGNVSCSRDGLTSLQPFASYPAGPSMPLFESNSWFQHFMYWDMQDGTMEIRDITTGRLLKKSPTLPFNRFLQASSAVYGFGSGGFYYLSDKSAPWSLSSWQRRGTAEIDASQKAWVFDDMLIVQKDNGSSVISLDHGESWDPLSTYFGTTFMENATQMDGKNPEIFGSLICLYRNGTEIWATASSGGTFRLYFSPDNGRTWRYRPHQSYYGTQDYRLGTSSFETGCIFYSD